MTIFEEPPRQRFRPNSIVLCKLPEISAQSTNHISNLGISQQVELLKLICYLMRAWPNFFVHIKRARRRMYVTKPADPLELAGSYQNMRYPPVLLSGRWASTVTQMSKGPFTYCPVFMPTSILK